MKTAAVLLLGAAAVGVAVVIAKPDLIIKDPKISLKGAKPQVNIQIPPVHFGGRSESPDDFDDPAAMNRNANAVQDLG